MKKILFFSFLLVASVSLISCSLINAPEEQPIPIEMVYEMGDKVLRIVPNHEMRLLDFSLEENGNVVNAQIGEENYEKFISLCTIFQKMDYFSSNKEYSIKMRYKNCADKFVAFSEDDTNEDIQKLRAFYDEIIFLASADIE